MDERIDSRQRSCIGGAKVVGDRLAPIAGPVGGSAVDAEARAAVGQILVALRTHGLIAV